MNLQDFITLYCTDLHYCVFTSVPHHILIFPFDVTDSKHEYEDADPDFKNIVDPEQEKYQHKLRPGGGTVIRCISIEKYLMF